MKFLIDAQLPPALARALSELGHEAAHVLDLDLQAASDLAIWHEAQRRSAAIITKDEDFIAGSRGRFDRPAVPVVWIRIGNASRQALLTSVLPLVPETVRMIEAGEIIVEIRGS